MEKSLSHVKKDVEDILHTIGLTPDNYALLEIWEKEAGQLARACTDVLLKGNTLYACVDSPVCIQELSLRKREIIKKINDHFARPVLKNIKYRLSSS